MNLILGLTASLVIALSNALTPITTFWESKKDNYIVTTALVLIGQVSLLFLFLLFASNQEKLDNLKQLGKIK